MNAILRFLFGKQTDIFNKKGTVEHDLGKNKWQAWNDRLAENPNYDYRKHVGFKGTKKKEATSSRQKSS